jgi:hypothetical protein
VLREVETERDRPPLYQVVVFDRLPLGTPYPRQVDAIRLLTAAVTRRSAQDRRDVMLPGIARAPQLVMDSTGVGRAVVDMARERGLDPVALEITGGMDMTQGRGCLRVPKRQLVSLGQVLFQTDRLKIAGGLRHARTLVEELLRFKVKIDPVTAHDSYGTWREGEHDDLVLAVLLALWWSEWEGRAGRRVGDSRGWKPIHKVG